MKNKIFKNLETHCTFKELDKNMADEDRMKAYLLREFDSIFKSLYATEELNKALFGQNNLSYGAAHLWSYKFNKRIGQYVFPKEANQKITLESIKPFFKTVERAKFFDITNILSTKKQPIINKRGSYAEMQADKNFNNPEIILPEDILFPPELKPKNFKSKAKLILAYKKAQEYIEKNANNEKLSGFFDYLAKKHQAILGVNIKKYRQKHEILKLFPPILLEPDWQYIYRFITNLVPDKPSGGYFIRVRTNLTDEQVKKLQSICNFIFGKLALRELELLAKEEITFQNMYSLYCESFDAFLKTL